MSVKQDRQGVRTVADLERKYLSSLVGVKKALENNMLGLTKTNTTLEEFMAATLKSLDDLQDISDGNITTWFKNGEPTLDNAPANEWTTEQLKDIHTGDLYYDRDTGYAYRFVVSDGVYEWIKLSDNDIVEALALANSAKDAADGKRRVFIETPTPPYDRGDLWLYERDLYVCQIAKTDDEEYETADFIIATKYTDDTVALGIGQNLEKNYTTTVDMEAKIKASQEEISVEVSKTYSTKDELTGVEDVVKEVKSTATQTAEKISWVVKSGTSESDFTITDRMASLTANYINLNGLVTFSGLNSETQNTIIAASTNATDALALYKAISVGGTNLLRNTKTLDYKDYIFQSYTVLTDENGYQLTDENGVILVDNPTSALSGVSVANPNGVTDTCAKIVVATTEDGFTFYDVLTSGCEYTFSFWVKSSSSGSIAIEGTTFTTTTSWKRVHVTFTASGTDLCMKFGSAQTYYIYHAKLEIGNLMTDWSPSPDDVYAEIEAQGIANWCYNNDVTYIDGGKIYTGTITAKQIAAGAITADKIDVNDLFAQDITAAGTITGAKLYGGYLFIGEASDTYSEISADGVLSCKGAVIDGEFNHYSTSGYKSLDIQNNRINFFSWSDSGNYVGSIGALTSVDDANNMGIGIYADYGDRVTIGYKEASDSSIVKPVIRYDSDDIINGSTPYIANTANGSIFPKNPNGGIIVENGLIKEWSLAGANGTIFSDNPNGGITVKEGLITGWSLRGADGTIFSDNPSGGITVKDGLITGWSLAGADGTMFPNNPNGGIAVKDGLIVDFGLASATGTLTLIGQLSWDSSGITSAQLVELTVKDGLIYSWKTTTETY